MALALLPRLYNVPPLHGDYLRYRAAQRGYNCGGLIPVRPTAINPPNARFNVNYVLMRTPKRARCSQHKLRNSHAEEAPPSR